MKPANPSKVIIVPRPPVNNGQGESSPEAAENASSVDNVEAQATETSVGAAGESSETPVAQAAPSSKK